MEDRNLINVYLQAHIHLKNTSLKNDKGVKRWGERTFHHNEYLS